MTTKRFRIGDGVMVQTTKVEFEHADGLRGRVVAVQGSAATIEWALPGESDVIRLPLMELVSCSVCV